MNREQIAWHLKRPFPAVQIHWRQGPGGKSLAYLNARDVMKRLDEVVGPWGWQTHMHEVGNRVACSLTILYDGEPVTKTDGAGDTQIEGDKGSFSDALKRAAVQHGIGRFLYYEPIITPEQYDAKVPYPEDA